MFCPNCGKEIPDGSAFCGNCGARLDASASQPAGGPQQGGYQQQPGYRQPGPQQNYQQPGPQQPPRPSAAAAAMSGLVPFLKAYIASPVAAAKSLADKRDMTTAIILLAIQAVVGGLVIFSLLSKICSAISDVIFSAVGLSGLGSLVGSAVPSIGPSFIMSLIWGIVAAVVGIALFVVVAFGVAKLMKANCTIQDVLILCGAHSLFVTALLVISFILFFLSIWLGAIAFSAAMIAWMVMGVVTVQTITPDKALGKFWMLLIAGMLVVQLVGSYVGSKCVGGAVNAVSISYQGQSMSIGEMMDEAGNPSISDIIGEAFSELFY